MKRMLVFAAAAVALAGCAANQQYFEPTERVQAQTQEGRKVAIYPISVSQGSVGEAKVWSDGAHKAKNDDTFVSIGLEVRNTSAAPLVLQPGDLQLDVLANDYGPISGLPPQGDVARTIPPGGIAEANPVFELPPGVKPEQIAGMRLHWQVRSDGQVYAQVTPFDEEVTPTYSYYGGPYDPCWPGGCYGPWIGYGFGGFYAPRYYHGYYAPIHHGHVHYGHGYYGHGGHYGHGHGYHGGHGGGYHGGHGGGGHHH